MLSHQLHLLMMVCLTCRTEAGSFSNGEVDGGWGQWNEWTCSVTCRAVGTYVRQRACDAPWPRGQGRVCLGQGAMVGKTCDRRAVLCPHECGPGRWDSGCRQQCPHHCVAADCHKETGLCKACQPGYNGQRCETACPDWNFGLNCSEGCSTYCTDDCGAAPQECPEGMAEIVMLGVMLTILSLLPSLITVLYFLNNYRRANFSALTQDSSKELAPTRAGLRLSSSSLSIEDSTTVLSEIPFFWTSDK